MSMSKLEGEISTKVAGVLSKLEEQLTAKADVGPEFISKIQFAKKMLTMIDTKVSNANREVSTRLDQLDDRMTQVLIINKYILLYAIGPDYSDNAL